MALMVCRFYTVGGEIGFVAEMVAQKMTSWRWERLGAR